jgi:hypothetical protein
MSIVLLGIEAPTPRNDIDRLNAPSLEGGVTIFARADTRARMNQTTRGRSRVAAIVDARPGYGKLILPQHP